jgi:hypothetical protein
MVSAFFISRAAVLLPIASFIFLGAIYEPIYRNSLFTLALANIFSLFGVLIGGGMFRILGNIWNQDHPGSRSGY